MSLVVVLVGGGMDGRCVDENSCEVEDLSIHKTLPRFTKNA